ncbi:ERF family protein [Peptostreptococcus equinus]|uniref:ERF family protein n=1 Tax=Peptostreptococcus equinus TaxID=3003601 RepID=A0ABY7JP26_9FIRM|nr:ERF family protein [Peptostreptococcus sp. CBA3647]WAW14631.1 ERF family protein [Peptostreptococcus sp. CBA3647]WAW15258.1 ERF family protein [Peptostreptococcus sp. CBA3647]
MNIYEKLQKIQNELKVPKERDVKGRYKYRSADDIYKHLKPLADKYNVSVFVSDEIFMANEEIYIKAICTITDGEGTITANAYAREPKISKTGQSEQQITGATSSYARKYAMGGMFLIDNDSIDADEEEYQKEFNSNYKENKNSTNSQPKQDEKMATKENIDKLKKLLDSRGFTEADVQGILKNHYKAKTLEQLTAKECKSFYDRAK